MRVGMARLIRAMIVRELVYYIVRGRSMHSGRRVAPETVEEVMGGRGRYNIPESLRAFCNIVSLTAAKTSRMLEVSVACVRLGRSATMTMINSKDTTYWGYKLR